jgi:hypothetical protein
LAGSVGFSTHAPDEIGREAADKEDNRAVRKTGAHYSRKNRNRQALRNGANPVIRTIADHGYRSLRELVLPSGQLSIITGANGSGKSSVYRSLRFTAETTLDGATQCNTPKWVWPAG